NSDRKHTPIAVRSLFAIRQRSFQSVLDGAITGQHPGDPPMNAPAEIVPPYRHTPLFPLGPDRTRYRKLGDDGVRVDMALGREVVVVPREALRTLAEAAFTDINHLLRPGHLKQLAAILDDPEATENDKFVAY